MFAEVLSGWSSPAERSLGQRSGLNIIARQERSYQLAAALQEAYCAPPLAAVILDSSATAPHSKGATACL
jgi:hypothetical protein